MIKKIVILALIFTFMIMSLLLANWQINKHSSQSNLTKEILAKNEKPLNNAALVTTDYEQYIYEEVILNGKLDLGTWQGIYLCEHRNRCSKRRITATIQGELR